MKRIFGVVLAGGSGKRFGADRPKQYLKIGEREVISFVIDALKKSTRVTDVLVAASADECERLAREYGVKTGVGGAERNITVFNALEAIRKDGGADGVIFVDSARPLLTPKAVDAVAELLDAHDAVITAAAITDSLGKKGEGPIDRSEYYLVQTPEAFRFGLLDGFDAYSEKTAIIQQVDTEDVYLYYGLNPNFKITYPKDLAVAAALLGIMTEERS